MKGVGNIDNTSNPNHSLSRPRLSRLRYGSNFCTYLLSLMSHGYFCLGTCVRTVAKTMVVEGRNDKPLALLCLALGPPLNAANSSEINFKADLVR